MAIKIPTLKQMKRDRSKTTYEYSVNSLLSNIHAGICSKQEYLDVPFMLHNEEDRAILEKIITEFNLKGHKLEKVAEVPEKRADQQGKIVEYIAVRLRIHIEPLTFVEKSKEKKTVEKMVPVNRLDSIELDESEESPQKAKKIKKVRTNLKTARPLVLKRKKRVTATKTTKKRKAKA